MIQHFNFPVYTVFRLDIGKAFYVLNNFRLCYFYYACKLTGTGDFKRAKELTRLLNERFPKERLPFTSLDIEKYFNDLYDYVENNYQGSLCLFFSSLIQIISLFIQQKV